MTFTLKDYQYIAANDVTEALRMATESREKLPNRYWSVSLTAPTGAGKTVIAAAVIETLFYGRGSFAPDPDATVLWVTDNPALNEQTKRNMLRASKLAQLETIDSSFDQATFDPNHVYFLNVQKLARSNPLARSNTDGRTYSIWQTIANTIDAIGGHFYVVIDEAHRGMKRERDRRTVVSRIINGQNDINAPAPIVWGISATPGRFLAAIERWSPARTLTPVAVPIEDVRASGLLKDMILLDKPAPRQMQADTTLLRAAVKQTLEYETAWREYAEGQGEPPVVPALVIQIPNDPSNGVLTEYLNTLFNAWPDLRDANVVNTFSDHTALSVGGHIIQYMQPQDIQDDKDVRVVLAKDAVSTGWDCPRAEVLISLRAADDETYIEQLIGRMVRTPLARSVPGELMLNNVNCYLPRFNRAEVDKIVNAFAEGTDDEPPVEVIVEPVRVFPNEAVPEEVFEQLATLPTYTVPGRIYRTQMARLRSLATLLAGDNILEGASQQVRIHLNGVLIAQRQRLESDGSFARDLQRVQSLRVERSYVLLAAESLGDLEQYVDYETERDDKNIEDLYRVALRRLPEGVADYYWNHLVGDDDFEDSDPTEAKAITAVMALQDEVVEAVEAAAEQLVRTWLREYQSSISQLSDVRRAAYDPVRRQTRAPELTTLELPPARFYAEDRRWERHLLADEDGTCPMKLGTWETKVLERELADDNLVAWYRNPTGGPATVRVPYRGARSERPMYPDFIMFHRTDDGLKPSIIDPHGYHLSDAASKLRGLAEYAKENGDRFGRIESVVELNRRRLVSLDLKSAAVQDALRHVDDNGVKELFEEHGGDYS